MCDLGKSINASGLFSLPRLVERDFFVSDTSVEYGNCQNRVSFCCLELVKSSLSLISYTPARTYPLPHPNDPFSHFSQLSSHSSP